MREDDSSGRDLRRKLLQARHEILVRETVKSVAANALVGEPAWQGERLGEIGLASMERRVEAGDLWKLRRSLHDRAHGRDIVRLMQGRERRELGEVVEHGFGDVHGACVL